RFGISFERETSSVARTFRKEETHQMFGKMMLRRFRAAEVVEVGEVIFPSSIDGFEMNRAIRSGNNLTVRKDIDGEIDRHRARMKEVQWPKIERAAREVDTTRRVSNYAVSSCLVSWASFRFRHQLSVKNCAMFRNLL